MFYAPMRARHTQRRRRYKPGSSKALYRFRSPRHRNRFRGPCKVIAQYYDRDGHQALPGLSSRGRSEMTTGPRQCRLPVTMPLVILANCGRPRGGALALKTKEAPTVQILEDASIATPWRLHARLASVSASLFKGTCLLLFIFEKARQRTFADCFSVRAAVIRLAVLLRVNNMIARC